MVSSNLIPIQKIVLDCIKSEDIVLNMARLDNIHPLASGNKIYKLAPIIQYAKTNNINQIVSFGGAFSNHIHALALLAKEEGIESIAYIRGEIESAQNPTLQDVQNAGMRLIFVDRAEYKKRHEKEYLAEIQAKFPNALIVAEGGSHPLAIGGCQFIVRDINNIHQTDVFAIACGTGASAAGMICGLSQGQHLHAYSVLKDNSLDSRISDFITTAGNKSHSAYTFHAADFGGYAKLDKSMLDFIINWLEQTGILLDPIYTSKMCRRVVQQIKAGEFNQGQSITLIHSGGLQGWRGMQKRVESLAGSDTWAKIHSFLKI